MVKRVLMVVAGSFLMMACGPGAKIDGKQGAADAMFAASQPTKAKADTSATPVDLTGGIDFKCPQGGAASINGAGISIGSGGVGTSFNLKYDNCGLAQSIVTSGPTISVDQSFICKVLVQGAYDDFIDVDVKESVAVGDLGAAGTGVSVVLKGTIKTSQDTFTFDETVSVVAGQISAKIEASR